MQKYKLGLISICGGLVFVGLFSASSQAAIIPFENDPLGWETELKRTTTIDFDGLTSGPISGREFISSPGSPVFELQTVGGMYVGVEPFADFFVPTSDPNAFFPRIDDEAGDSFAIGEIRVSFSSPVSGMGAFFLDVGPAFDITGFDLGGNGVIDVKFSSPYDPESQTFLGFTTDMEVRVIDIHFGGITTESGVDNVAIDDLSYAAAPGVSPAPEPAGIALFVIGIVGFGFARRKGFCRVSGPALPHQRNFHSA